LPQAIAQFICGDPLLRLLNHARAQISAQGQRRGIAHPRQDPRRPRQAIGLAHHPLGPILADDHRRMFQTGRIAAAKQLQGKMR
jgi:hypothetical protein